MQLTQVQDQAIQARMALIVGAKTFVSTDFCNKICHNRKSPLSFTGLVNAALVSLPLICFTPPVLRFGTPSQAVVPAFRPYRTGFCRHLGGILAGCMASTQ